MEITKRFNYKKNRKEWSVFYGAGTSKTIAFFPKKEQAKLFIDWITLSDYARIDNNESREAYWKYQDSLK
jgi:hypothetical protein